MIGDKTYDALQTELVSKPNNTLSQPLTEWLSTYPDQLSEYGKIALLKAIKEDELVLFFRNNHFTTMTRHQNVLYNLVTDVGYEREQLVVWDSLDDTFVDSKFCKKNEIEKEQLISTCVEYGLPRQDAEKWYQENENNEPTVDKALKWLAEHSKLDLPDLV